MKYTCLALLVAAANGIRLSGDEDFPHWMNGFGGYSVYKRDVPDRFETEQDDKLMESMYNNYATEGKDKKTGMPNGHFWVTTADAMRAAEEVASTHLKLAGGELETYVKDNFATQWKRYDVNGEGKIDVDRMPAFLRTICGNAEACIGL